MIAVDGFGSRRDRRPEDGAARLLAPIIGIAIDLTVRRAFA
jgi:hypothetical protein